MKYKSKQNINVSVSFEKNESYKKVDKIAKKNNEPIRFVISMKN